MPAKLTHGTVHLCKAAAGGKLLTALAEQGIFLASACSGSTCSQCCCRVVEGGGILSTEEGGGILGELRDRWRLSCQVMGRIAGSGV